MAELPEHLSFATWVEKRSLNKAAAALETMPLEEVADVLNAIYSPVLRDGETMPDWLFGMTLDRRLIRHFATRAVSRDQGRRSSVKQRKDSVGRRGRSAGNLRRDLWALAVKVENHYDRGVLGILGLAGSRPKNPELVLDLAILVRDNLRSDWFAFPEATREDREPLDRFELADALDASIAKTSTRVEETEEHVESAIAALADKHEAQDWATTARRALIGRLRFLLTLAQREDLAKRLRLRRPQTVAEAQQDTDGDPSGGEPSTGEPSDTASSDTASSDTVPSDGV